MSAAALCFCAFILTHVFLRVAIGLSKRKRSESVEGIGISEGNKACRMLQNARGFKSRNMDKPDNRKKFQIPRHYSQENDSAIAAGLNFSHILQGALKQQLNIV